MSIKRLPDMLRQLSQKRARRAAAADAQPRPRQTVFDRLWAHRTVRCAVFFGTFVATWILSGGVAHS